MPTTTDGAMSFVEARFPLAGLDVVNAFMRQPNRSVSSQLFAGNVQPVAQYARTAPLGINVRGWEPLTGRLRGGSRSGLVKYLATQPGGVTWITQELKVIVGDGYTSPGSDTVQLSQSGRIVTLVAVSQGNVYTVPAGGTTWTAATNSTGNTPGLNYSGLIYSSANNQLLYFADGINYAYYNPSDNTLHAWTASAGTMPADSNNNTPRLIETWRGRTLLSGLIGEPQNIFGAAVGDPTNWDYAPAVVTSTQAFKLNLPSIFGLIGDAVTCLLPFNDDILIVGTNNSIRAIQGDPMAGGQVSLVTRKLGMAWGIPWDFDPYGNIYFFGNPPGVYVMSPGSQPQRISQSIEPLLRNIDTGANTIRLLWDDRYQGLHVFITPLAAPAACTHYFWEWRSGAWWQDVFANQNHNPLCCCSLDGNTANDRVPLIGSWDGYVRTLSPNATDDDGTAIASSVMIGPLVTKDFDDIKFHDLQGILGETSGSVSFSVYSGVTAEAAASATPVRQGTFAPSRNLTAPIGWSAHGHYVRIDAVGQWAMESIRARTESLGKVRRRGK